MLAIAFAFALGVQGIAQGNSSHPFVDLQVAELRVGKDKLERVIQLHGKAQLNEHVHGQTLCYFSKAEKVYLIVALNDGFVVSVILSSMQDEKKDHCPSYPILKGNLATGKGVRLGQSPESVIKIYGKPEKSESKSGILIFEYHTDNTKDPQVEANYDSYLYFKNGKLVKLVIHDGP